MEFLKRQKTSQPHQFAVCRWKYPPSTIFITLKSINYGNISWQCLQMNTNEHLI